MCVCVCVCVHRGMCATEDRQKRGQDGDPVTARRTARVSILVGRERRRCFSTLPVCVCECHVKTSIELQGERTDERRQGSTKERELDRVRCCVRACP